ncbi:hypothetical protein MVEN_00844500 [Mycena venus]|uniref:Protein kinase domain-containing protein n=1 Tax=Mycena venus TaxID=2733690 RepID=A0A8H6YF16_9AGAR|nr:hypothetical protein MVEN_00844500 [Mycena venus]
MWIQSPLLLGMSTTTTLQSYSATNDGTSISKPPYPDSDSRPNGPTSESGCRVSRRLGTVWNGVETPRQERPRSGKTRRTTLTGRLKRGSTTRAIESGDSGFESDQDLSLILDCSRFVQSPSPDSSSDLGPGDSSFIKFSSGSDSDEDFSFIDTRHGLADPHNSDDINCLNCFAAYSAVEFWSVDLRLTLLWCLAYEARFRRRGPALELWLAIIEGTRERVDWGMWEDGDEAWLRNMVIQHRMTNRFRVPTFKLSSADWMLARDALERRVGRPRPSNPLKGWSTEQRILRIAWCAVTDGVLAVGRQYLDLMKPIDCWTYFTCPFRSSSTQDMKLRLHDQPQCSLSSCKVGVWQWFKTAILDYDLAQIRDVTGCCGRCISRALSAIHSSPPINEVPEPPIWPVILWVAFRIQTRDSSTASEAKNIDVLLDIIQSKSDEHLGLWSWDDTDEQMLRQNLISPSHPNSSWIDRYPSSWREYIILLDSSDWAKLEGLTRESSRAPSASLEYDSIIRIGAIVLWTSSNMLSDSPDINVLLSLEIFLPGNLGLDNHGFLRCLLERRVPVRANHYELNLGPEIVDWHQPRTWLDSNREQLRSSVLSDPDATSLLHVVENVYMVYHVARALPLRFMSSVFACLLRKFKGDDRVDQFRSWINIWKTWDTNTCLVNFRWVLATTFEFSKLLEEKDLPMSLINVVIHTDIRCICAQFADILGDRAAYQDFLKAQKDDAQKLLDLLQDLLDYPLLDSRVRPVILKALVKLSTKSGRHPRCFTLSDRLQLANHPAAAGSFGDVWKGLIHAETVSVKIMRVYQEADVEALLKEFYREALIWRQLSHPNLLPFFGAYYLEGTKSQLCLVSPWMENGDVSRYLKGNPEGVNRLNLVLDIALGLDHLHRHEARTRRFKSSAINVLVTRSGRAVLADFGLSSVTDSKILLSASTVKAGGTMRWQAPELFRGNRNSFASDVYAFSCVCYEIFTGTLPFHELSTDVAVMYHVMQGERPQRSSSIPEEVWNLMQECWNEDPQDRLFAEQIVFRLRNRLIGAIPTNAASDWDPWYTSKFRSSLEEHTLFLSCGKIDDWLQFTRSENSHSIRSSGPIFSARAAIRSAGSETD